MKAVNDFMFIFRFTPNNDYQPSKDEQKQQHVLWEDYMGKIASEAKLVGTSQLGFEGIQIFPDLSEGNGIHSSDNQIIGGNMTIKALDLDDAKRLAKDCPILKIGGSVEIRTIIPM